MRKLSIAFNCLALLAAGAALAQTPTIVEDTDWLTPTERVLLRQPNLDPEWTWIREGHANAILLGSGYSHVLSLEKGGAFWRGKALKDNASYHVAVNRYAEVVGHIDRKSLIAKEERATPFVKTMPATLNGPIGVSKTQSAPTYLPRRPAATVMGEVGWTWLREDNVTLILKSKGYSNVSHLRRDDEGIWRAMAVNRERAAVRVAIDVYSNVEALPGSTGGVAQADWTE